MIKKVDECENAQNSNKFASFSLTYALPRSKDRYENRKYLMCIVYIFHIKYYYNLAKIGKIMLH